MLAVAVVVAGLIAGWVLFVRNTGDETGAPKGGSGFQERAQQAGIAFRMNFLPKEQGERFRINLYDHGSGLAVGDYDNDGHEDIYFLNQHGPKPVPFAKAGGQRVRGCILEGGDHRCVSRGSVPKP